jgi:hypothetical protein
MEAEYTQINPGVQLSRRRKREHEEEGLALVLSMDLDETETRPPQQPAAPQVPVRPPHPHRASVSLLSSFLDSACSVAGCVWSPRRRAISGGTEVLGGGIR